VTTHHGRARVRATYAPFLAQTCRSQKPVPAATVYGVKNEGGRRRYFNVAEGVVTEHASMEAAFGPMLNEPHPTLTFEHNGKTYPAHHYSLCWGALERYEPMTAQELAALRVSRERKKAEREEAAWHEQAPLFPTWAERNSAEEKGNMKSPNNGPTP
jgi:hypothetical protein